MNLKPSVDNVSVEQAGAVAVVSFANSPEGTITVSGAGQLLEAMEALLSNPGVSAIVLTGGQEGIFIRHADVSQIARSFAAVAAGDIEPEAFKSSSFAALTSLLDGAPKPVIAAIDGTCMGGGLEIALACTLRVAGVGVSHIGLPEIRIGIFPGAGGIRRLTRLIGTHQARRFVLRGEIVDAHHALDLGLVDEVAPSALFRAKEIAAELANRSPAAIAAIMDLSKCSDDPTEFDRSSVAFASLALQDPALAAKLDNFCAAGTRLEDAP